ncbi:MAG: pilus assembly protein TadG-related protein [Sporichthyaceae bacterium]|nr:pilus assembly protein TadG-related protein [Sporichthyaceae bacterium]
MNRGIQARIAGRDRGSLSVFIALITPPALVLIGLVVDGGMAITARERAADIAEQAARRVADNVDTDALRAGRIVILPDCYAKAAEMTAAHGGGQVEACTISGPVATVTITYTYQPAILGMIGFDSFQARAVASAEAVVGVTAPGN